MTPNRKTKTGRRELTDSDKARIASLAATGVSYGQITAELNIPRSTVRDFLRRVNDRGHYENKPRSGRPRKTTAQIDDLIIQDKEASLQDIQLRVVPNVSLRTIKRRIKEAQMGAGNSGTDPNGESAPGLNEDVRVSIDQILDNDSTQVDEMLLTQAEDSLEAKQRLNFTQENSFPLHSSELPYLSKDGKDVLMNSINENNIGVSHDSQPMRDDMGQTLSISGTSNVPVTSSSNIYHGNSQSVSTNDPALVKIERSNHDNLAKRQTESIIYANEQSRNNFPVNLNSQLQNIHPIDTEIVARAALSVNGNQIPVDNSSNYLLPQNTTQISNPNPATSVATTSLPRMSMGNSLAPIASHGGSTTNNVNQAELTIERPGISLANPVSISSLGSTDNLPVSSVSMADIMRTNSAATSLVAAKSLPTSMPISASVSESVSPMAVASPLSISNGGSTVSSDMAPTMASLQSMKLVQSSSAPPTDNLNSIVAPLPGINLSEGQLGSQIRTQLGPQMVLMPQSPISPPSNANLEALCPPHEKMFAVSMDVRNIWNTDQSFNNALMLLPIHDQPKIERMSFRHDAKMALASQLLRRYVVAIVTGTRWLETEILKTQQGRPYVPGAVFDFNISHMSGFVVIVVRLDRTSVGVDVACFTPPEDWAEGWMQGFRELFSPAEFDEILAGGVDSKYSELQLAHRWALKEAYTKALGIGLVTDLSLIEFRNLKLVSKLGNTWDGSAELWVKGVYQDWRLELFLLDDDLIVAIATPRAGLNPTLHATPFKSITMADILKIAVTQYF